MARSTTGPRATEQVGLRVSKSHHELLEAVAFLLETNPSALARQLVEDFVDAERARNPRVDELLRLRAEEEASSRGELASIRKQGRKRA